MRLRMLMSQSFSVSAWPALPDWALMAAEAAVKLRHHTIEHGLGNRRVAPVAVELVLLPLNVFEHIGFEGRRARPSMISKIVVRAKWWSAGASLRR